MKQETCSVPFQQSVRNNQKIEKRVCDKIHGVRVVLISDDLPEGSLRSRVGVEENRRSPAVGLGDWKPASMHVLLRLNPLVPVFFSLSELLVDFVIVR